MTRENVMRSFKSIIAWLALLLATSLILYVVSYFLLVKRVETVWPPRKLITKRVATSHVVTWGMPRFLAASEFYLPLARLDNTYLRPHYWQTYEVSVYPDGKVETNFSLTTWQLDRSSRARALLMNAVPPGTPAVLPPARSNSVISATPR